MRGFFLSIKRWEKGNRVKKIILSKVILSKVILCAMTLLLSACQITSSDSQVQVKTLQEELAKLKHVQTLIAQKVGLGSLVRPDNISIKDGQRIGDEKSQVVLLEFTDLHCPFCAKYHKEIWPKIKAQYIDTGKVLFVGKEYPLAKLHPRAAYAAVTLRCAANQGKYVEAKNFLFEKGQKLAKTDLAEIVESYSLDKTSFDSCLKDSSIHAKISDSLLDAKKLGLASTPTFIIGKRQGDMLTDYEIVSGAGSVNNFKKIFDKLLAQ